MNVENGAGAHRAETRGGGPGQQALVTNVRYTGFRSINIKTQGWAEKADCRIRRQRETGCESDFSVRPPLTAKQQTHGEEARGKLLASEPFAETKGAVAACVEVIKRGAASDRNSLSLSAERLASPPEGDGS